MEVLVAMGLFYMGYKFRQDTSKDREQNELHEQQSKQTEKVIEKTKVELEETKHALEETQKQYFELTLRLTRTQIITGLITVGLLAAAYGAYKAYEWQKIAEDREKIAEERAEEVLNMDNAWQCVVCEDNEKTVVYLPCNHLAVCSKCDAEMSKVQLLEHNDDRESCPICRSQIMKRVNVHVQ